MEIKLEEKDIKQIIAEWFNATPEDVEIDNTEVMEVFVEVKNSFVFKHINHQEG